MKELKTKLLNLVNQGERNLKENQLVLDEWYEEIKLLKDKEQKEKINKKYEALCEKLNEINLSIYTEYYNTLHALFSNEMIDEINKQIGYDFMSEKFLNVIFK